MSVEVAAATAGTAIGPALAGTAGALAGTVSSAGTGILTRAELSAGLGAAGFGPSDTGVPAVKLFMLDMFGARVAA